MNDLVKTKHGEVKGYAKDNAFVFRGIPYADTPRFEMPKEINWDGVFDATQTETDAYQLSAFHDEFKRDFSFYSREFRTDKVSKYGDGPAVLNIITPKDAHKLPVFVFIHGGGFETGTVGENPYGDTTEYAKRGVVFVSISYRLNVFSWYKNMNLGLFDQEYAIKWVYENIEAFGGDKDNIVIGGQSAGAMSTIDLLLTKRLEGIVKGAIVMSGAGPLPDIFGPKDKEKCDWFWDNVREGAGCKDLDDMKKVDPKVLWESYYTERQKGVPLYLQQPGIDGTIIPSLPSKCFKEKKELDVPVLIGVTGQDFMPLIIYIYALKWAKDNAKKGKSPIYGYFFDKTPPGGDFKAFHACDLWYAFGNMDRSWRGFKEDDIALKDLMIDYFANFVKSKNPNGDNLPEWDPVTKKFKGFRYLNGLNDGYIMPKKARKIHFKVLTKDHGPM
ncbi:MAG: carboxylesterase family protein [Gammaproteobacteria bacterium]|nr:carboxylesterase family protein [Gammaproteobacteria bacterium]